MTCNFLWRIVLCCIVIQASDAYAGVLFKRDSASPDETAGFSGIPGWMAAVEFESSTDPVFTQKNQLSIQAIRFFLNSAGANSTFRVRVLRQAGESSADLTRPTSAFTNPGRALADKLVSTISAPGQPPIPGFTKWFVFKENGGQDVVISDAKFFIAVELVQSENVNIAFDTSSPLTKSWFFDDEQWHNFINTRLPVIGDFSAAFPGGVIIQTIAGIKGDVNGNGSVNLGDAGRVVDMVLGRGNPSDEFERFEADFDNDGSVPNLGDAIKIIDTVLRR